MTCKNCEYTIENNFCSNCGQKSSTSKINFKYITTEIIDTVFQVDHGFLFTIKELFTRPGNSIREFLKGKRKQHYKPIPYFLVLATLYVFLAYFFDINTMIGDALQGSIDAMNNNDAIDFSWITKNETYIMFLTLPFFSLTTYLAFLKSNYNYFEHFVLNSYIMGQQILIYMVFSFILFNNQHLMLIPLLLAVIYNICALNQFFNNKKKIMKFLLIVLTYLLNIIIPLTITFISVKIIKSF